ncbi:MAG: 3-dehydroquinate synthase [Acidimicrobiaceae bacterium]|nr:3-dehydroquinate synthase [Acidimicrobiia bacterium]MCY4493011.1 3-dehydroquinate synthase [Acidimicrobiaceae bacterium]
MTAINVELRDRPYPVHVGPKALEMLGALIPSEARRVAVITQESIPWSVDPSIGALTITVPDGESAKSLSVIEDICRKMAVAGFTRADVVVAVGGGVVTDIGGFAAAVYHRGIRFINVATTLLAQVDAAIGGKTGVNLVEGKNLVGAFWQPTAVICDTEMLTTLPIREYRSGLGEVAKYHFLGSVPAPNAATTGAATTGAATTGAATTGAATTGAAVDAEVVAACVQIKADVVAADEREGGRRAILNYGHTLAHAIETAGAYDLRHGEAVAVGIAYAAEVARRLGRISDERVTEHHQVLSGYDLPCRLPRRLDTEELLGLFKRDKKAVEGVTLVLDGPDGVEPVSGIDPTILRDALGTLR